MSFSMPCLKRHLHAVTPLDPDGMPRPQGSGIAFHYGHERGIVLEDVDAAQLRLLSLLDGQHTFDDIVARLQAHDPAITASDVAETLDQLAELGLVEDAAASVPDSLTATDLTRYAGQIRFFSILDTSGQQRFEMQARLKRARVAVLGLGGLGSNVVMGLAAAGVGFIRGVDGDTVELGNLNRQVLYDFADIGQPKVAAAAAQMQRFNPDVQFEPVQRFLDGPEQIAELIRDVDVVAMCADSPRSIMMWMNSAALATGTPFITGGYRGMAAEVGPFVVPFETACLACLDIERPPDAPEELAWIEESYWLRHPTTYTVSSLAASLTCADIIKYLTGFAQPATCNLVYELDIERFAMSTSPRPRNPQCAACATRPQRDMSVDAATSATSLVAAMG